MKKWMNYICALILLCLIITTVSAASVEVGYVKQQPTGDLEAGTPVTADFSIDFYDVFPADQEMTMTTELEDAVWKSDVVIDGVKNPQPTAAGKDYSITGWILEYPDSEVGAVVSLSGKAPAVDKSKDIQVVGVYVANANGKAVETVKEVTSFVVNPGEITGEVSNIDSNLQNLKNLIAEYQALGIDTSKAEEQQASASSSISQAESASYSNAQILLANAQTFIDNGMVHLDYGYADKYINDTKNNIEEADSIIEYLKTERGMTSDPRLAPIITTREFAAEYVQNALDLYNKGSAQDAKDKAVEAFEKSKTLVNDITALQEEIGTGGIGLDVGGIGSFIPYIIIIIIVIVALVLVFFWLNNRGGGGGKGKTPPKSYGKPKKKGKANKNRYDELF